MIRKIIKSLVYLSIFIFAITVNANSNINLENGTNNTKGIAKVGNVDVPTYEVVIYWEDLKYDWTYDNETKQFNWTPSALCEPTTVTSETQFNSSVQYGQTYYADNACTTKTNEYTPESPTYYLKTERENVVISIVDNSQFGQISPSIKWTPSSDYSDVKGNFIYLAGEKCTLITEESDFRSANILRRTLYNDANCNNAVESTTYQENTYYVYAHVPTPLTTEKIPEDGRMSFPGGRPYGGIEFENKDYSISPKNNFYIFFTPDGGSKTPTKGDAIGKITISIEVKKN